MTTNKQKPLINKRFSDEVKLVLRLFYINCQGSGDFELQLNIAAVKIAGLITAQLAKKDDQIKTGGQDEKTIENT